MSNTYKGYELIKELTKKNVPNETEIKVHEIGMAEDNIVAIIEYKDEKLFWKEGTFDTSYLLNPNCYFEIMENQYIDIQEIEELDMDKAVLTDTVLYINKLVKAVKQLNKNKQDKE